MDRSRLQAESAAFGRGTSVDGGSSASEPRSSDGQDRQRVDLIVGGEVVVTSDEARPTIERGAVAVAGGRIVAVDGEAEIAATYDAEVVLPGEGMVVMPGLI